MVDGTDTRSVFAPASASASAAASTAAFTSSWMPSLSVSSSTMPTRRPSTPRSKSASSAGAASAIDVESHGSCPPTTSSSWAASATVVANGPIWSRDDAKATSP